MSDSATSITVKNSRANLFTKLRLLKEQSQFVDVTLMSNDGYSCQVHACVVAAQSDFLQQVLAQHMSKQPNRLATDRAKPKEPFTNSTEFLTSDAHGEATASDDRNNVVDTQEPMHLLLEEFSSFMLKTCIEYMYGEVTFSYTRLNDVIKAADYLKIDQLKSQCVESFVTKIATNGKVVNSCSSKSKGLSKKGLSTCKSKKGLSKLATKQTPKSVNQSGQCSAAQKEVWLYCDPASGQIKSAFQSTGTEVSELDSSMLPYLGDILMQKDTRGNFVNTDVGTEVYEENETVDLEARSLSCVEKDKKKIHESLKRLQTRARPTSTKSVRKYTPAEKKQKQQFYNFKKEYICTVCGLKCLGRTRLSSHMIMVHERKYVCKYCNRAMRHEQGLREHEARHEGKYLMMCDQCDYQCYGSGELCYHKKSRHSGERHQCEICKAVYGSSTALRYHKATHGEPLKCDQCDFTDYYNHKLRNHIEAFHSPTVAECDICHKVFPNLHRARNHQRSSHVDLLKTSGGNGQVSNTRHTLPIQNNKYGTVEYDAHEAKNVLGKAEKTGDGRINSYITKRLQTEADRDMLERSNKLCVANRGPRKPKNIQPATVNSEDNNSTNVDADLNAVTMALVQQGFEFEEHGDSVVYIEAGTGRIVSASEVQRSQLQIISSQYTGEEGEDAQMDLNAAQLVQM